MRKTTSTKTLVNLSKKNNKSKGGTTTHIPGFHPKTKWTKISSLFHPKNYLSIYLSIDLTIYLIYL